MSQVPLNTADNKLHTVHASRDTTLTALAQLAALRLNVKRAMVSLLQKDSQIILAEATQTLSLADDSRHAPGDHIWLGQVSVPRHDALDEHVLGAEWTGKDGEGHEHVLSALVVQDVGADERFKERSYVWADPGVKFYAGVPIVTKQGYEIGVYGVSDTKPRSAGLSVEQILFMQDIARIIADHLERVKTAVESKGDEIFVRGMHNFIEGVSNIKYNRGSSLPEQFHAMSEDQGAVQGSDPQDATPTSKDHTCMQPNSSQIDQSEDQAMREIAKSHDSASKIEPRYSRESSATAKESAYAATSNIKQIYQRAAVCLRDVLDAQGCVILDASSGLFANSGESENYQSVIGRTTGEFETDAEDESVDELEKAAAVLGASFAKGAPLPMRSGLMKRKHFKTCLTRYPNGEHFYFENGNIVTSQSRFSTDPEASPAVKQSDSDTASNPRRYRTHLPKQIIAQLKDSKWLVFLPLYNHAASNWCAGLFLWSNDTVRDLGQAMSYFRTFCSCLVSEVASMDAFTTSAAKSTFIASISHDLRSPLHGILGSLEFLEDTMTTAYQTSLVGSIETCGRTLLDTIDHLLDYAKINSMNRNEADKTGSNRALGQAVTQKEHQETAPFDLGLLLEEVVEAVFAGQTFRKTQLRGQDSVDDASEKIRDMSIDDYMSTEDQIHTGSAKFSGRVFFILDVRKSKSTCMKGQTGGLRRVIMNIVGNAIKYCSKGTIEIVLTINERSETMADVEINVNDTGIGMSQTYLENHLFKAFSQEDPFTPGAGLGLSIASQVMQSMNGKIRIDSEQGVGTRATISFPMELADRGACASDSMLRNVERVAAGQGICLLNPLQDPAEAEKGQLSKLTASIARTCEDWFGMKSFPAQKIEDDHNASIYVYCEPPPIEYLLKNHTDRKVSGKTGKEAALLIICTNAFEAAALRAAGVTQLINLGRIIEVISQPVGVRKLARTILQSMQRIEASSESDKQSAPSLPIKQIFESNETTQRAASVNWKTSTSVYDPVLDQHRPSIEHYRWKSEQPVHRNKDESSNNKPPEFGDLKAGRLPGFPSAAGTNVSPADLPHVLVVDDNAINLRLLVTFMKKIKLPYSEAVNGLEAFNRFKETERPFDFVLMDLQMPVMDGLESTRKIREYERETKVAKPSTIIAITGVGNEATRKEAADAGMTQYLTKPVKFKALQQMLEKQIEP